VQALEQTMVDSVRAADTNMIAARAHPQSGASRAGSNRDQSVLGHVIRQRHLWDRSRKPPSNVENIT